jgi:hypothetical protein
MDGFVQVVAFGGAIQGTSINLYDQLRRRQTKLIPVNRFQHFKTKLWRCSVVVYTKDKSRD